MDAATAPPPADAVAPRPPRPPRLLVRLGERSAASGREAIITAGFLGEVMQGFQRLVRGRSGMRARDLLHQIDRCGPQSLPIAGMTCALIGLMLAYMGGVQLQRIGATSYIASVVSIGVVREMTGMMIGIILAGRLSASFAAQLGSMVADEEVDALRALGIDVVDMLVMPRVLALVIVAPMLWALSAVAAVVAGLPVAVGLYDVPAAEYLYKALRALEPSIVLVGVGKCVMYCVLVAIAGCREGLYAGRSTEAVGDATTRAVVKALVWIVVAASLSTVVLQSVGI